MLIDVALEGQRREGLSSEDAIHHACLLRFRPILMTTMCALSGGVPLMLGTGTGSEIRQPLGYAIVGGLLVSQVLTLFAARIRVHLHRQLRAGHLFAAAQGPRLRRPREDWLSDQMRGLRRRNGATFPRRLDARPGEAPAVSEAGRRVLRLSVLRRRDRQKGAVGQGDRERRSISSPSFWKRKASRRSRAAPSARGRTSASPTPPRSTSSRPPARKSKRGGVAVGSVSPLRGEEVAEGRMRATPTFTCARARRPDRSGGDPAAPL